MGVRRRWKSWLNSTVTLPGTQRSIVLAKMALHAGLVGLEAYSHTRIVEVMCRESGGSAGQVQAGGPRCRATEG